MELIKVAIHLVVRLARHVELRIERTARLPASIAKQVAQRHFVVLRLDLDRAWGCLTARANLPSNEEACLCIDVFCGPALKKSSLREVIHLLFTWILFPRIDCARPIRTVVLIQL